MPKLSLGKAPKTFTSVVRFPMLDGTEGVVDCTFKYRTITEYGSFVDGLRAQAGATAADANLSLEQILQRTRDKNGQYLLQILEAWNLDVELSTETAQQLCDEFPGANGAIIDAYRAAIVEGRRGN